MLSLDVMKEYVHAADELESALKEIAKWEGIAANARVRMEDARSKIGTPVPEPKAYEFTPSNGQVTEADIKARALRANKKVRGEVTLAVLKAMPGTIPQIVERTGVKKTTVSTLVARLQNDGLVLKKGKEAIPGYESRTTTVYDLAV